MARVYVDTAADPGDRSENPSPTPGDRTRKPTMQAGTADTRELDFQALLDTAG